jgi:hypothetical protein
MSQMNRSPRAFVGAATAASFMLWACHSVHPSEPAKVVIAVSEFQTSGDAKPAVAQDLAAKLAAALNADPDIKAGTEAGVDVLSRDYILKGSVYLGEQRAFVALQLVDAKTTKRVWSENYDYRGIGTDMMAAHIRAYLQTHASED